MTRRMVMWLRLEGLRRSIWAKKRLRRALWQSSMYLCSGPRVALGMRRAQGGSYSFLSTGRMRCIRTGRPRGVNRWVRLARPTFRVFAGRGLLSGWRRYS
jgi:ribosomal protein S14